MTDKQRRWFKVLLLCVETGVKSMTAGQRALVEDLDLAKQALGARFDKLEAKVDRIENRLDWLAVIVTRIDKLIGKVDELGALTRQADQLATGLDERAQTWRVDDSSPAASGGNAPGCAQSPATQGFIAEPPAEPMVSAS